MAEVAQQAALAEFAKRVIMKGCWEAFEVDGETLQAWAEELGLIYSRPATTEDTDRLDDVDIGDPIYRLHEWLADLAKQVSPPSGGELMGGVGLGTMVR